MQYGEGKFRQKIFRFLAYTVIIPLLITILLVFIYGMIFRVNIFDMARNYLEERDEIATLTSENEFYQEQLARIKEELDEERERNEQLQQQLEEKEQEIEMLTLEAEQREQASTEDGLAEDEGEISLVKTFREMKPKQAAGILIQLDEGTALDILRTLDEETLANILEKMPPEDAARLTARLVSQASE